MKLRIRGNSIRLRLLRSEVEQFGKTGRVEETICFGAAHLTYVLEFDRQAQNITAHYADGQITIKTPDQVARNWIESEEISLQAEQSIETETEGDGEKKLTILIEKDFVCLERKDDPDNADAFPHPTGKCA